MNDSQQEESQDEEEEMEDNQDNDSVMVDTEDDTDDNDGITLGMIRDGVVIKEKTLRTYAKELIRFLEWSIINKPDYVHPQALSRWESIKTRRHKEPTQAYNSRITRQFITLIHNAHKEPVLVLDAITAEGFMKYVLTRRHKEQGGYFTKASYINMRAALFHLYRLHNSFGFPEPFRSNLATLYQGFFRQLKQHQTAQSNGNTSNAATSSGGARKSANTASAAPATASPVAAPAAAAAVAVNVPVVTTDQFMKEMKNSMDMLRDIKSQQQELISLVRKVKTAVDDCKLARGVAAEDRIRNIFDKCSEDIRGELDNLNARQEEVVDDDVGNDTGPVGENGRIETVLGHQWHYFDGAFHRIPKDFRFPRSGVWDLWYQWWIGDKVRGIPPLSTLTSRDVKFLDDIPLSEEEKKGRTGPFKNNRRPGRKILNAMNVVINYIMKKVKDAGKMPSEINPASVAEMYKVVEHEFGGKNARKKWLSMAKEIEQLYRDEKNENK